MTDISNKFLAVEIWAPFLIIIGSFLFGYGQLSAQVANKVNRSDQVVVAVKVEIIEKDVTSIKTTLNKHIKEQQQRDLDTAVALQKILSAIEEE